MMFGRRKISQKKLLKYLDNAAEVLVYDTLPSTNLTAKEMALTGKRDVTVIANTQTDGRGRLGRSFYSPKDSGIYLSYIYPGDCDTPLLITTAVSVAVCNALVRISGKTLGIKWVNDIYLENKKICGILAEGVINSAGELDAVVVGVGINIYTDRFPDDIADIADSLYKKGEKVPDINLITAEVINELKLVPQMIKENSFINKYKEKSVVTGRRIRVISKTEYMADAIDIDNKGALVVRRCDTGEEIILNTGEISIRFS